MRKIKINEQQARMLKEIGKKKVLKVTKEQYKKITEFETINEMDLSSPVTREFNKHLSSDARKDINNTKVQGVSEMYESFINELYGITESDPIFGSSKTKKLTKLMEAAGMVNRNRIVKEKFYNDKNIVKEIISLGLQEMLDGGSEYSAMEVMEEALDLSKDMDSQDIFKAKVKEFLQKNPNPYVKNLYMKGDYKKAWLASRKLANQSDIDEASNLPMGAEFDSNAPYNQ